MRTEHFALRIPDLPTVPGMVEVEVQGEKLLFLHLRDGVFAVAAKCPHAGAPLVEGAICGRRLVCPWHQSVFDVSDGRLREPPSLDDLPSYPVRIEDDEVYVTIEKKADLIPSDHSAEVEPIMIIGAGPGGQAAAEALRREGWRGRIVLIGREPVAPYDRTALSKMFLSGEMEEEQILLREGGSNFARGIERMVAEITHLDAPKKTLHLADGTTLSYHGAILATGGIPTPLKVPGAERVLYLRSLADANRIREKVGADTQVVIIGASFIGLETASALRKIGAEVTVVAPTKVPFGKQLGPEIGGFLLKMHEEHGVQFRLENKVEAVDEKGVRLESGSIVPAEVVIGGVGVKPATDFLHGLPLAEDGGVIVDAHLHAAHNVYAIGDIASFPVPHQAGDTWRIEHWRVAMQHGRLAARNLAGHRTTLAESGFVPFFWTYYFGERFGYVGHATKWDSVIFKGHPPAKTFLAYYIDEGRAVAAFGRGCERELAAIHELLVLNQLPPPEQLDTLAPAEIAAAI